MGCGSSQAAAPPPGSTPAVPPASGAKRAEAGRPDAAARWVRVEGALKRMVASTKWRLCSSENAIMLCYAHPIQEHWAVDELQMKGVPSADLVHGASVGDAAGLRADACRVLCSTNYEDTAAAASEPHAAHTWAGTSYSAERWDGSWLGMQFNSAVAVTGVRVEQGDAGFPGFRAAQSVLLQAEMDYSVAQRMVPRPMPFEGLRWVTVETLKVRDVGEAADYASRARAAAHAHRTPGL